MKIDKKATFPSWKCTVLLDSQFWYHLLLYLLSIPNYQLFPGWNGGLIISWLSDITPLNLLKISSLGGMRIVYAVLVLN
jgi:hypothetical protein